MLKKNKNDKQNMSEMTRVIDNKTIHCKSIIDGFASMFNRQNRWPDNHPKAVEWVDRSGKNIKTSLSEFESRLASNTYLNGCLQISQNATAENFIRSR